MVMLYLEQSFLANVAFLTIGVLLAITLDLVRDGIRRPRQARDLAHSLYHELANRVARCVFDFEEPWEKWVDKERIDEKEVSVVRLRKFIPIPPTIYPATAGQIGLLNDSAAQAIIRFYVSLAIYQKDMEDTLDYCQQRSPQHVPRQLVAFVAERLRRTLAPGLEALRELSRMVEGHENIEAAAIRDADKLFKHERSSLTLRQRIEYYVNDEQAPSPARL